MIARYNSPTVAAIGRAVGDSVGEATGASELVPPSAGGALEEAPSALPAGEEMVAVGGAITKGKLLSAGRVEGTKVVGRIVGERVGEPEGRDEGLSEGHNERY